jgi:hypothetical protein
MKLGREALEGGTRLAHVRSTRKYLYIVQLVILLVAVILFIAASGLVSMKPFYLPVNSFIYFVLLMGLIFAVEGFFFRVLEMRFNKSSSTKYYMAKMSIRRALIAIVIAGIVIVILWVPFIANGMESALSSNGTLMNTHSQTATSYTTFYDRDALGLRTVNQITMSETGGNAQVFVVSEDNFLKHGDNFSTLIQYRVNIYSFNVSSSSIIPIGGLQFGKYYLVLDTVHSTAGQVQYDIKSSMSATFLSYVPFFALLFVIAYTAWIVYLLPVKRKYSSGAIYK